MTDNLTFMQGNITNRDHQKFMLKLLDLYMKDPMGKNAPLDPILADQVLWDLKNQQNYRLFFVLKGSEYIGVANCFVNYSTFKGKHLINIHDFAVDPKYRGIGASVVLMNGIIDYARNNCFCRVSLEVRNDNIVAQNLYKKMGFNECDPPMYFWEKDI